jgi:uncharacterized protein
MKMSRALGIFWGCLIVVALQGAAHAQGIDCSKARTLQEKVICVSPALMILDHQIAVAYAGAVARKPDQRAQMRQELIGWLRQRDAACTASSPDLRACLASQMTARLAALQPAPPPPIPAPIVAATPTPPAPEPTATAPATAPAAQTIPSGFNPPQPAGQLDRGSMPAAEQAETLLHVTGPGRFSIVAHSPSGAALQLVDMLAGPSDIAGSAGSQDGRLDQLLDVGTYKLRVFSSPSATGNVALSLAPFHDAAPPAALPQPGRTFSATLADLEQRAFWLSVPDSIGGGINLRIEAAGRALGDLRLWRDGRELVDLAPSQDRIEPSPGHPMLDFRLTGHVEPGTYLVIAYGGAALPWTDNDGAQPFHLRSGASPALSEGWAGGQVGPFGSEIWALPPGPTSLRLDLPTPAAATLEAAGATASIAKNSRTPSATLATTVKTNSVVELRAAAGQAYTLRPLGPLGTSRITKPGSYFVTAATAGVGGDEVPPSLLLQLFDSTPANSRKPPAIVASTLPLLGENGGWHATFNLRGNTRLLFQSASGGEVAVRSSGLDITTQRDGNGVADLPPGYFALQLTPKPGVQGVLDLIVGKPGQTPPENPRLPPDPVIPLGVQTVGPGQSLSLTSGTGPGIRVGLVARPVPVALAEGPLAVTVAAGAALSVPVQTAPGGTLGVAEIGAGPVAFTQVPDAANAQHSTITIPTADHARTLVLFWHRAQAAPPPIAPPAPADQTLAVTAGTPAFFDLRRDEERGFTLTVPDGGLYRIETLGRLHTAARLATPFIAKLGDGDANGFGQNALIQTMLRAGRYRVDVKAQDSTGHLGLSATPAPLLAGATLRPGGSVRASLPAGTGVSFPIDITEAAPLFRLHVDGIGAAWTGRLEDSEGWPITAPGPLDGTEQALRPGHYRLLVSPDAVARRVVARLEAVPKPVEITGHGPHKLPFGEAQTATWREPDGRDQPRMPDRWQFGLAGEAHVTLRLDPTMTGELKSADGKPIRITGTYKGVLTAGSYTLDTTSLGRNDRLAYTVRLTSEELQPDQPREVKLPAKIAFSLATSRVASLTSFGTEPVRAVLRDANGTVIGRYGAREDDWNIAASRLLPAGTYRLDLSSAAGPDTNDADTPALPSYGAVPGNDDDNNNDNADSDDDAPAATDPQKPQTDATQLAAASPKPVPDAETPSDDSEPTPHNVTLRLTLPPALPPAEAPITATALPGQGVHVLTLKQPQAGSLLLAQATSPASLLLTLEREAADGWHVTALAEGRTPAVASPADADPAAWRLEVWALDGGPEPITLAARAISPPLQQPGNVTLAAIDAMPAPLAAAHAQLDIPGMLQLAGAPEGLLVGGWPGHALLPHDGDIALLSGRNAWLIAPQPATLTATSRSQKPGETVTLSLPAGLATPLPATEGRVALWKAESGLGLPGLGGAMGVAAGSTLTLATGPITLRRADGDDDLRLRLTRLEPTLAPAMTLTDPLHGIVPPGTALPVTLPAGDKRLALDLQPGTAAIIGWKSANATVIWAGDTALSRDLDSGSVDVLLVNTGPSPAPAALSWQIQPAGATLHPGVVIKRFFGTAGSFEVPLDAATDATLATAGDASLTLITADGSVQRGTTLKPQGAGRVIVRHGIGPMAVWVETNDQSPWPIATAQPTAMPAHLALSGPGMALALTLDRPMLLHATTTSPVLIALHREGLPDNVQLYGNGAAVHRMLPAGASELRIYSPHDGPLSGSLDLTAEPIIPAREGLGEAVSVAPGSAAVFGFSLAKAATIGVGVRADPDTVKAHLLDETGKLIGDGVAQLRPLPAGRYLLEAQVAPDAATTTLRPAIIGITPRGNGPPPDVAAGYLTLVGMKQAGDAK